MKKILPIISTILSVSNETTRADSYRISSDVMDPIDEGIDPLRKLSNRTLKMRKIMRRIDKKKKASGNRYKEVNDVRRPSAEGIVPRKRLLSRYLEGNVMNLLVEK